MLQKIKYAFPYDNIRSLENNCHKIHPNLQKFKNCHEINPKVVNKECPWKYPFALHLLFLTITLGFLVWAETRLNCIPYWLLYIAFLFLFKRTYRSWHESFNSVWDRHRNTAISHFCVNVFICVSGSFCCSLSLMPITRGPSWAQVLDLELGTAF